MRHTETFVQRWHRRLRGPITRKRVMRYLASRMQGMLEGGQATPAPSPPGGPAAHYPGWIAQRVRSREKEYSASVDPGLLSVITSVYDTPPTFLREMADSVFAQDYPFQWAICDNGSRDPGTKEVLEKIAADPRVVLVRIKDNAGIMGGTRAAFEVATGDYVLPVDSDDRLYPDALRVMASCLEQAGYPLLAYSDEDKILADSVPCSPFFKPDWDPALFLNCCYIAHLCAISRDAATAVDAYTDDLARGCHDLDTFTRLLGAGHVPLHVPEILYSWRIHAGSTSSISTGSKTYTIGSQRHVLTRYVARLAPLERVEVRTNPLFGHVGMWYPCRRHVDPVEVQSFVWAQGSPQQLQNCVSALLADKPYPRLNITVLGLLTPEHQRIVDAAARLSPERTIRAANCPQGYLEYLRETLKGLPETSLVATISDQLAPINSGWAWEAFGVFDVHPDAVACAPRIFDSNGMLSSAGEHFGFGGLVGAPDQGRSPEDSGYHGWVFCQRSVSALPSNFHVCRKDFLIQALEAIPPVASRQMLGAWLGAIAADMRRRIVYTPFLLAQYVAGNAQAPQSSHEEVFEFLSRYYRLVLQDRYYSRFLQLQRGRGFDLALPHERATLLNRLLSRLEGPTDFLGSLEVDPNEYSPAVLRKAAPGEGCPQLRVA